MYHISRLSEAVYVGLCHKIGTPTEVRFRREVMETEEVVGKRRSIMMGLQQMTSGSRREGFNLSSSDHDIMYWYSNHKVICDLSHITFYRVPQNTLILMDCDDLPPGFTRLNLMSPSNRGVIRSSCIMINNENYISSTLFRYNILQSLQDSSITPHGPSVTTSDVLGADVDRVICLQSHHWPTHALPWKLRCRHRGWPSEIIVSDISSGGFHVVPIGSTPENGEEWRISFSQAEQKLVYSMNHSQFLCYGLFKVFLKEVINFQENEPILCSYFIKTIVFWVIQTNNSLIWTPDSLLNCFWECLKLLIFCVHIGNCPNFFIPQNNMFRLKVTGCVQTSLFHQLYELYCKGIPCLLLSPTLRPYLNKAILNRTLRISTDEGSIISIIELDVSFFRELYTTMDWPFCFEDFAVCLKQIERVLKDRLTPYQATILQWITSKVLRRTSFFMQSIIYPNNKCNKVYYKTNKVSGLLKLSCSFGCVSDSLYLAMYFYRTYRYEHSLNCLQRAQDRISLPYIVYNQHVNVDMYRFYVQGACLSRKFRRAKVDTITLEGKYTFIDELVLEQKVSNKNRFGVLFIPPLVMLHMLFILNHHRLRDTVRSQQSLQILQTLLLQDNNVYVPNFLRDISWQILGICQQICGDYVGSQASFQISLQQEPLHKIQEATLLRMNTSQYEAMQF
ncbi:uncharacterized protein LOC133198050 [Saccostrea echinata]|uniref:uncharacterized protein LOC133198050 n=1 Tax=Saccostrea echinata TaxID=191078 RepID=UPI002A7FDF11|nr:uncharacterized protein LOC133198050 [Saccostrea echinata]